MTLIIIFSLEFWPLFLILFQVNFLASVEKTLVLKNVNSLLYFFYEIKLHSIFLQRVAKKKQRFSHFSRFFFDKTKWMNRLEGHVKKKNKRLKM